MKKKKKKQAAYKYQAKNVHYKQNFTYFLEWHKTSFAIGIKRVKASNFDFDLSFVLSEETGMVLN